MDEKKCPFCAEVIKAEAIKCRFCGSLLDGREATPSDSVASVPTTAVAACEECNVALVPAQVRKLVSAGGLFGMCVFLFGVLALPFGIVPGLVIMAIGVVVSSIGGKKTVMVCPKCGTHGKTIAA